VTFFYLRASSLSMRIRGRSKVKPPHQKPAYVTGTGVYNIYPGAPLSRKGRLMTIGTLLSQSLTALRQITARYQNKLGLLTYMNYRFQNTHSKREEQKEFSPSASRLMPGFATREMSARLSDRFRFRIPHQSFLCVRSKEQSFLVLTTRRTLLVEQTIITLVLVAFLLSVPIHHLFRLFFTTYHPIVRPLLYPLRIDRPTRDSRGETQRNGLERKKKKNQQRDRSTFFPSHQCSSTFANVVLSIFLFESLLLFSN